MRQSKLFTKTQREAPKDEVSKNAELLLRAGFINKEMAGVYSLLPLGLRVLKRLEGIIREEMNSVDGQEVLMPSLHPKENWEATGRWETMDDLYKVKDASDREFALGPTHEEIVVPLAKRYVSSYRDLPFSTYQFQTKFRMELRAKSGILRGREFIMKDMYSFHADEADLDAYYERVRGAYERIFEAAGIGDETYFTFASGGSFSKYSHEFQTVTEAGEDTIFVCEDCHAAVNKEIIDDQPTCPMCGKSDLIEKKAIETGNIFKLMTKYSEPFSLNYKGSDDGMHNVIMGCYGIGLGRLMGTVVEVHNDDKGIVWPEEVAPFDVHLVALFGGDEEISRQVRTECEKICAALEAIGVEVLYDDREGVSAGEKLKDSDLIGIPVRILISEKTLADKEAEVKIRRESEAQRVPLDGVLEMFSDSCCGDDGCGCDNDGDSGDEDDMIPDTNKDSKECCGGCESENAECCGRGCCK